MSFCVGVAIAMHLAFVNMKPYLYFLGPQIEVSKECDITDDVLKTSRTIKPNNLFWERPPDICRAPAGALQISWTNGGSSGRGLRNKN